MGRDWIRVPFLQTGTLLIRSGSAPLQWWRTYFSLENRGDVETISVAFS
jgi:hypothetical protein